MKFQWLFIAIIFLMPLGAHAQYKKVKNGVWQGTASFYHNKFNGRLTANGEVFSNGKMTAANNFLKLGAWVRVTNTRNGKSVIVKINDRMNKRNKRLIDMSRLAAKKLGYINSGLTKVKMEVLPNYKRKKGKKKVIAQTKHSEAKKNKTARVYKFPAWAKIILAYDSNYKVEKGFVDGALPANRINTWFKTESEKMKGGKSYRLILLSRKMSMLKTLNIIPLLESEKSSKKAGRYYAMVNFKPKDDHFVFYFDYDAPQGASAVRFEWEAEMYSDITDEDFALFVFED